MSSLFSPFVSGGFASFERDPETVLMESNNHTNMHSRLKDSVNKIVEERGLRELSSDYLGMSTYYYEQATQTIWEVDWNSPSILASPFRKPSWTEVSHLSALNHQPVSAESYATQRAKLIGF